MGEARRGAGQTLYFGKEKAIDNKGGLKEASSMLLL